MRLAKRRRLRLSASWSLPFAMSTAQQAARGRAAYRRLLRAVDTHITAVGGNTTWRDAVRHRFREARSDAGPAVETALRRAEDLAFMVNSVNEHKVRGASSLAQHGSCHWCTHWRLLLCCTRRTC